MRANITEKMHNGMLLFLVQVYDHNGELREQFTFKTRDGASLWIYRFQQDFPKSSVQFTVAPA